MKKELLRLFKCLLTFSLIVLGTGSMVYAASPIKLSWSEYVSPNDYRNNYWRYYIKRIAEETNNQVEITLYPAQQLVKARQQYEALIQGTIDMCALIPAYYAGKMPLLTMLHETTFWEIGDSAVINSRLANEIDQILNKDGVKFLGWSGFLQPQVLVGPRVFKTFDDIKGLKIRAPGSSAKILQHWGATGVSISAAETYMAMQKGIVDGAYTSMATVSALKMWEIANAITYSRSGGNGAMVSMNLQRWNELPASVKAAFEKVSREMPEYVYNDARHIIAKIQAEHKKNFKEYHEWTEAEYKVWTKSLAGVFYEPVIKKFGSQGEQLWEKILAVANENRQARLEGKPIRFH
ncbi:TRAP transporter substrate-binding protein DctP [bacterium]|nr:TRAP transporter substrate-binding protein DctP [bacterium]